VDGKWEKKMLVRNQARNNHNLSEGNVGVEFNLERYQASLSTGVEKMRPSIKIFSTKTTFAPEKKHVFKKGEIPHQGNNLKYRIKIK